MPFFRRSIVPLFLLQIVLVSTCGSAPPVRKQKGTKSPTDVPIVVTVHADRAVGQFRPSEAFGGGVDGHERGSIARMYTPANLKAMASAGFKPLTYRLRTELAGEAWHWNPKGIWSDASHKRGYWTSDATPGAPIQVCNGYSLPRRGNSIDQANNRGYSRLTDGDPQSFWKSNPYLDRRFTGEDNAQHPQWVVLDLRQAGAVDTIRLRWGTPYAVSYRIEYYSGLDPILLNENETSGGEISHWIPFPQGTVRNGHGGDVTIRFASQPTPIRFLRILMTSASGTAPTGSTDVRDGLGYALREVYLGTVKNGRFVDRLQHGRSAATQTLAYTSSTDPWHSEADRDPDIEQPGFDRVFQSPLTNGHPVMIPVAPLYDTPENAAAEIRYLKARGYPLKWIEMGEEPDGQSIVPEDYAALYRQFAIALHAVDPALKLGGPGFQTNVVNYVAWPDAHGDNSWFHRFLKALQRHPHEADLDFFTFEWYPFDNICQPTQDQIVAAPEMLRKLLSRLERSGLSRQIPWMISEYGYSSSAGRPEVEMAGAILNADIVAQFLMLGGKAAYFYGYEPTELLTETKECESWGNLTLFQANEEGEILRPVAAYYGARLLTQEWVEPGEGAHTLYAADCPLKDPKGQSLVTVYAVQRSDRQWALLLLNKDPKQPHRIRVQFEGAAKRTPVPWTGAVRQIQYASRQYVWHPNRRQGYAQPNLPPAQTSVSKVTPGTIFTLPAYSITVLRTEQPN